jgi:hypothetical protein
MMTLHKAIFVVNAQLVRASRWSLGATFPPVHLGTPFSPSRAQAAQVALSGSPTLACIDNIHTKLDIASDGAAASPTPCISAVTTSLLFARFGDDDFAKHPLPLLLVPLSSCTPALARH